MENKKLNLQSENSNSNAITFDKVPDKFSYAGFFVRLLAFLVDVAVFLIILWIVPKIFREIIYLLTFIIDTNILVGIYNILIGKKILLAIIIWLLYNLFFIYKFKSTLGKKVMGLKIISDNFNEIPFRYIVIREISKFFLIASAVILVTAPIGWLGILIVFFSKERKTAYDMLVKTIVVYTDSEKKEKTMVRSFLAGGFAFMMFFGWILFSGEDEIGKKNYLSYLKNFELTIPLSSKSGVRIRGNGFVVIFTNDFGELYRIENIALKSDNLQINRKYLLHNAFYNKYFNLIKGVAPDAKVIYEKYRPEINDGMLVVVLDVPNGSVTVNMKTGKRSDAKRVIALFVKNEFMYIITVQREDSLRIEGDNEEIEIRKLNDRLLNFVNEIKFNRSKIPDRVRFDVLADSFVF